MFNGVSYEKVIVDITVMDYFKYSYFLACWVREIIVSHKCDMAGEQRYCVVDVRTCCLLDNL